MLIAKVKIIMTKCPHCGFTVSEFAYTCVKCGRSLNESENVNSFAIKREPAVRAQSPAASRRRRRGAGTRPSNIEAIRAMQAAANEEMENNPSVIEEPVSKETPIIEEPVIAPVLEESVFVEPEIPVIEPVIEETVTIEPEAAEVNIEEPEITESIIEEPVITEEPAFAEPEIEAPSEENAALPFIGGMSRRRRRGVRPSNLDAIKALQAEAEEDAEKEAPTGETAAAEELITEAVPVTIEPVITPVLEEPVIIEPEIPEFEPEFEEPVIVEPIIEEPEIIEPVIIEPEILEPIVEEPVIEELIPEEPEVKEPEFIEPKKEDIALPFINGFRPSRRFETSAESAERIAAINAIAEPEIEETVIVEPEIEEPVIVEPEIEEPVIVEPEIEEPVIAEPEIEEPVMEDIYSDVSVVSEETEIVEENNFEDLSSDTNGKSDDLLEIKAEIKSESEPVRRSRRRPRREPAATENKVPPIFGSMNTTESTEETKELEIPEEPAKEEIKEESCKAPVTYTNTSYKNNSYTDSYRREEVKHDETFDKIFGDDKKKSDKKANPAVLAALISVGVIALVVVVILLIIGLGGERGAANIVFRKDNMLYSANLGTGKAELITEEANADSSESLRFADDTTYISEDGSLMIYTDKTERNDDGFTLYMKEADAQSGTASLIDGDIYQYTLSENNETIAYLKGNEGSFRIFDIKENGYETVDTSVKLLFVNKSCDRFLYLLDNGVLYMKDGRSTPNKISDNAEIEFVDKELEQIYFTEDGELYLYTWQEKSKHIASGVISLRQVTPDGKIYYVTERSEAYTLYDFIDDDMLKADEKIEEPEKPVEPSFFPELEDIKDEVSEEEYTLFLLFYEMGLFGPEEEEFLAHYYEDRMFAYEQDMILYEKALEEYENKLARDELRAALKEYPLDKAFYNLYYYDGKESTVVSEYTHIGAEEGMYIDDYLTETTQKAVIRYSEYDTPGGKMKLSEVNSVSDAYEKAQSFFSSVPKTKLAIKAKNIELPYNPEIFYHYFSESMDFLYILGNNNYGEKGNLYKIAIGEANLGEMQRIETDIYYESFFVSGDDIFYRKNSSLYYNREELAEYKNNGINSSLEANFKYIKETDTFYYINRDGAFTIKDLANGEEKLIDSGVYSFYVFDNGEFYYNKEEVDGEFSVYTVIKDKITLIVEDVDSVRAVDSSRERDMRENIDGALDGFAPLYVLM